MDRMTTKRKTVRAKKKRGFEYDQDDLAEYSKPAPRQDQEGFAISQALSRIMGRTATGYVTEWRPEWMPEGIGAFRYFFFEDRLIVDTFSVPAGDMDVLDSTPGWIEREIATKRPLCDDRDLLYIAVRPDEELDMIQLAARLGRVKVKKEQEAKAP